VPYAPAKACARPGCGKAHTQKGAYCEDCSPSVPDSARDSNIKSMYDRAVWRKRFSPMMLRLNPICQRLVFDRVRGTTEQCHNPAKVVHHIISPRTDPTLFLQPRNVACLCDSCHPSGSAGTPDWEAGREYVETVLPRVTV
jgi:hypothetical protein